MKNKKMSLFFKIYLSVVAFFVLLLIAASIVLWTYLDAYETTRPKHVAKEVFETYFKNGEIGALIDKFPSEDMYFESAESINNGVKERYDTQKFEYFPVSTDTDGSEKYAVASEGKRLAYFTVSPTDKKASYGFKYYELSSAEMFFTSYGTVSVKVPKGFKLSINGIEVAEKFISEADIEGVSCKYMPNDSVKGVMYDMYTVKGLVFEPTIKVTGPDSREAVLNYNETEEYFDTELFYDEELKKSQSQYVIAAATEYTKYLSNDAPFSAIAAYLDRKATIYRRVESVEVEWVRPHTYKITEQKAEEFYKYSDDVYSCHVSLKLTMMQSGQPDFDEFIDLTLYLHKVDGKYKIYELILN